jgi:uncharacterized protein YbjQ (UPF0145 family)
MATCPTCGRTGLGFLEIKNRMCPTCRKESERTEAGRTDAERTAEQDVIDQIVLTTETASNLPITKRIEVVTAECAYGMNIFKDLFSGVRNIVGGRSEAVQSTMRDARKTVLSELKREAHAVGANAVVGVDLDYVELAGSGSSMLMLVASGTAVVIEDAQN